MFLVIIMKIYDIDKIKFIKKTRNKKGSLIYWVKVECHFKRIAKVYFSRLKKKGIKIFLASKTRCLGINQNNLQCKRISTNKYCFQHEKKKNLLLLIYFQAVAALVWD